MRSDIESEKIAEINKLLGTAYVEAMYESLEDTASFIKAAIESLKFNDDILEKTVPTGIVVEFTQRKSV